jgi:hypothetical protein
MPYNKTLVIDEITDDGAGQVTVPTILEANRINASVGDGGFVANLAGTTVDGAGTVTGAISATIRPGLAGKFEAGGAAFAVDGTSGDVTMGTGNLTVNGTTGDIDGGSGNFTVDVSTGDVTAAGDMAVTGTVSGAAFVGFAVPQLHTEMISFSDFNVAATSGTYDFAVEPTHRWVVTEVFIDKSTPFTGGAISAVECVVGDVLDDDGYIATGRVDLFSGTNTRGNQASDRGPYTSTFGELTIRASSNLRVTLNATGGNLEDLLQGVAKIYVRYWTLPVDS